MSRAALLPFPGDPFLLHYWLGFFDRVWGGEVDKLYIYHNSSIEKEVADYIRDLCNANPKINFQYNPEQQEHGFVIDRILDVVEEDLVILIEDDAFIFKQGIVNECFKLIEDDVVDAVGGRRGSCSKEIYDKASEKWGIDNSGMGDTGPNFWPCYFFCKKSDLLKTKRSFGAVSWKQGEKIEELDHVVQEEIVVGDTFVGTSLELRAMGLRFAYKPQYHGSPEDLEHYKQNYNLWDGKAPWTHVGSLSTGVGGVLADKEGRSLSRKNTNAPPYTLKNLMKSKPKTRQEKQEWERRIQWWLTFWQEREPGKIEEFAQEYIDAINRIIQRFELNMNDIRKRQRIYKELGL